jgi:hypothetical protein
MAGRKPKYIRTGARPQKGNNPMLKLIAGKGLVKGWILEELNKRVPQENELNPSTWSRIINGDYYLDTIYVLPLSEILEVTEYEINKAFGLLDRG